jgi:Transglycosylase SLT domain
MNRGFLHDFPFSYVRLYVAGMRYLVAVCLAGAAFLGEAWAGEYAVLASGARIHADSHESSEGKVVLHLGAGTIEMEGVDVRSFEPDEKAAAVCAASPARPASALSPDPGRLSVTSAERLADRAARKYGLPSSLVRSVMKAESGFRPQAVSPKGALGLMQLMPATAQRLGADPHDPAQNVDAGARYLRALLEKYGGGLRRALAAYNAGPAAVDRFGGVPPFAETLNYIRRIEQEWKNSTKTGQALSPANP